MNAVRWKSSKGKQNGIRLTVREYEILRSIGDGCVADGIRVATNELRQLFPNDLIPQDVRDSIRMKPSTVTLSAPDEKLLREYGNGRLAIGISRAVSVLYGL